MPAAITIDISPLLELGPITLAWHGIMTAAGIVVGALVANRYARWRGLDSEALTSVLMVVVFAGIVGAKLYFVVEDGALFKPAEWFSTTGFSFYGAMIVGPIAVAAYLRYRDLGISYLDAAAAGFPAGMAVGRIGDVINGEHYGPPTELPWGFRYTDPEALAPTSELAYHSGAFYEVLLAVGIAAITLPMWWRLRQPGTLLALVVGLYALGRFFIFFIIRDTEVVFAGLRGSQLTSLVLIVAAVAAGVWLLRNGRTPPDATVVPRDAKIHPRGSEAPET